MTAQSVVTLRAGERARIVSINSQHDGDVRKLTVFGLLPGMEIEVVQTRPVYVLTIDNTQLALDREAASAIIVAKIKPGRK